MAQRRRFLASVGLAMGLGGCAKALGTAEPLPTETSSADGGSGLDVTPSKTATPGSGGPVNTVDDPEQVDLVVNNSTASTVTFHISIQEKRSGETVLDESVTLSPDGQDGDYWRHSSTFSEREGGLSRTYLVTAGYGSVSNSGEYHYFHGSELRVNLTEDEVYINPRHSDPPD